MSVFHPSRFQGWGRTRNYFEGWYFKVVVPQHRLAYAFIPGISYDATGEGHAFLQVLDGVAATSAYHRYPTTAFRPDRDRFGLRLGPHTFSDAGMTIDLPGIDIALQFTDVHPWQKRPLAPGVMGWYGFVPRMQCYHGLVSYHHRLRGTIAVNEENYNAEGGVGYTEKDWGSGFPEAWIWCQSNHLSGTTAPASLMASVAKIPWLGTSFTGFLATFLLEGERYLFTTWNGSRVAVAFPGERVEITFHHQQTVLTITGTPAAGGDLVSPVSSNGMTGKINESLQATLTVRLTVDGTTAYEGQASWAGLEVSELAQLVL